MAAIAVIWSDAHPTAERFYKFAPQEPIAPSGVLKIKKTYPVEQMTAMTLFGKISKYAADKGEVLVVAHGVPDGPAIPLLKQPDPDSNDFPPALQLNAIAELNDDSQSEEDTASHLDMTKDQLRKFRSALDKVRKKKLKRIEFRACNLSTDALEQIRDLLGADVVGAPIYEDAYSPKVVLPRGFTKDYFQSWKDDHSAAVIDSMPDGDFGYWASQIDEVTFDFAWSAESKKAYVEWVKERFPSAKAPTKKAAFHGFWVDTMLKFPVIDDYRSFLNVT